MWMRVCKWKDQGRGYNGKGVQSLLFVIFGIITTLSGGLGALSLDTTSAATTIGGGQSEIDVLLGVL
jgi:hypothetical protein